MPSSERKRVISGSPIAKSMPRSYHGPVALSGGGTGAEPLYRAEGPQQKNRNEGSLAAQGHHRVGAGCFERRCEGRGECDQGQRGDRDGQRQRIALADAVEHGGEEAREPERAGGAEAGTDEREPRSAGEHEARDLSRLRYKR